MLVKDLMTSSVSVLSPEDSIHDAVKIMRGENIGVIPICDIQRHVLGIITDRDIIMRTVLDESHIIRDIMSTDVTCSNAGDDVHDAALLMARSGVRRLPVLENEKLVGILSLKDLAKKRIFIAEIGHIVYELSNLS